MITYISLTDNSLTLVKYGLFKFLTIGYIKQGYGNEVKSEYSKQKSIKIHVGLVLKVTLMLSKMRGCIT